MLFLSSNRIHPSNTWVGLFFTVVTQPQRMKFLHVTNQQELDCLDSLLPDEYRRFHPSDLDLNAPVTEMDMRSFDFLSNAYRQRMITVEVDVEGVDWFEMLPWGCRTESIGDKEIVQYDVVCYFLLFKPHVLKMLVQLGSVMAFDFENALQLCIDMKCVDRLHLMVCVAGGAQGFHLGNASWLRSIYEETRTPKRNECAGLDAIADFVAFSLNHGPTAYEYTRAFGGM